MIKTKGVDKRKIQLEDLNEIYRDIAERVNLETAITLHEAYGGINLILPKNFYSSEYTNKCMLEDYNLGLSFKEMARKYGYSERWCRTKIKRIIEKGEESVL